MPQSNSDALVGVMTISLFIILLAFFILLNSIAVPDEKKMHSAIGSLLENFGIDSGGYSVIDGTGDKPDLPAFRSNLQGKLGPIDFTDLYIADENFTQKIEIQTHPGGSMVRIPSELLFEPDGTQIKASAFAFLNHLGNIMKKNNYPVEISSHLDNVPHLGDMGVSNRQLTAIRAMNLFSYFMDRSHVPPFRMTAVGWGDARPAVSNRTPETRKFNRRVDVLFVHRKERKKPKSWFIFKDFLFKSLE